MPSSTSQSPSKAAVLSGRRIIVTGASRPRGIGFGIAQRCAQAGATVFLQGLSEYDAEQGYPDSGMGSSRLLSHQLTELGFEAQSLPDDDLADPQAPKRVFRAALAAGGAIDGLVLNHAYSVSAPWDQWSAEHIDRHFAVNVRASMLLLQEFAAQLPQGRNGSVVLLTSGQYLGPMLDEVAYAVSKEAIRGLCAQGAALFAPRGIRVNCINPGPTDTGYLQGEAWEHVRQMFPQGRWGTPEDAARLVAFLLSEEAIWITGQTIASEGGFQR